MPRAWVSSALLGGHLLSLLQSTFFFFNWRIIALQYCVGFYQISTWINHSFNPLFILLSSAISAWVSLCTLTPPFCCLFFFFFKISLRWTIFKVFLQFLTILLLFSFFFLMLWFFGHKPCGISAPWPCAAEVKVLTTGPPRKFFHLAF